MFPLDLKPCPFCNNASVSIAWVDDEDIAVHCGCGATGPEVSIPVETRHAVEGFPEESPDHPCVKLAVEKWNHRPTPPAVP